MFARFSICHYKFTVCSIFTYTFNPIKFHLLSFLLWVPLQFKYQLIVSNNYLTSKFPRIYLGQISSWLLREPLPMLNLVRIWVPVSRSVKTYRCYGYRRRQYPRNCLHRSQQHGQFIALSSLKLLEFITWFALPGLHSTHFTILHVFA